MKLEGARLENVDMKCLKPPNSAVSALVGGGGVLERGHWVCTSLTLTPEYAIQWDFILFLFVLFWGHTWYCSDYSWLLEVTPVRVGRPTLENGEWA